MPRNFSLEDKRGGERERERGESLYIYIYIKSGAVKCAKS